MVSHYISLARTSVVVAGSSTATGLTTLGTVPASKVWYITDIFLGATTSAGTDSNTEDVALAEAVISLDGASTVLFTINSRAQTQDTTTDISGGCSEGSASANSKHLKLNLPIKLTATQTVRSNSVVTTSGSGNGSVSVSFIGWEEDA